MSEKVSAENRVREIRRKTRKKYELLSKVVFRRLIQAAA